MNEEERIDIILGISKDIISFLEESRKKHKFKHNISVETLIYTLFNVINKQIENKIYSKESLESLLKECLNQYLNNSNLDLFVNKYQNVSNKSH